MPLLQGRHDGSDKICLELFQNLTSRATKHSLELQVPQGNSESFIADIVYFGGGFLKKQNLV